MMEFLSPWSLAGLMLVPAVFLWGLLAPRGRPVRVGSLMLWRRVLPEGAAGKPSARVRLKDPLIWLDAAAVLLVVLACSRPALKTSAPAEPVATLVIDRSAHMLAEGGGKYEFVWYNARAQAKPILQALQDTPIRVVYVPGADGAVAGEEVRASDLAARAADPWEPVLVVSDLWSVVAAESAAHGDLPLVAVTDLAPPAKMPPNVYVVATGRESRNVGLRRVACRIEAGRWWLFANARAAPRAEAAPLVVMGDDKVLATIPDFVFPSAEAERTIAMDAPLPKQLYVGLTGRGDDFPDDNAAHLTLEPAARLRIALAGTTDPALRRALAACDETEVMEVQPDAKVQPGQADLLIACGEAIPADWTGPAAVILPPQAVGLVRPIDGPASDRLAVAAHGDGRGLVTPEWRVAPAHPLAQALYLEPPRLAPVRRYAFEAPADLLLGTPEAPLAVTWRESGSRRLAILFGFDEASTDWPRRAGFPVFWSRALEWLVPKESRAAGYITYRPFEPLPGRSRVAPGKPGISADERGAVIGTSFIGTDEGFRSGPDRDDSQAAIEAIRKSVEAKRRAALAELWPYLAAAALVVLLARARVAR
ncbi:MAG: BatA domain-containing protein [Planctomycetota bacterium]|nr:BatA domain-containing protein [Planctomycetota bacterium]